jgi:hypothetical protein
MASLNNPFGEQNIDNRLKVSAPKMLTAPAQQMKVDTTPTTNANFDRTFAPELKNPVNWGNVANKATDSLSAVAGTAADIYTRENTVASSNQESDLSGLNTTLGMASTGAALGSVAGPLGTAIGAGVGLLTGGIYSIGKSRKDREARRRNEAKKREDMRRRSRNERERDNMLMEAQDVFESEIGVREQQLGLINNYR